MSTCAELVEAAFAKLCDRTGFANRPGQRQLALLISDLIEGQSTGLFEAPTGLGKSLATLVPAIANAIVGGRRTVIATYTNVLAEQYWRTDLPLAMSLFEFNDDFRPKAQLLMGRQRYACLASVEEQAPDLLGYLRQEAKIGHENEFRRLAGLPQKQATALWQKVVTPPVCPGAACPHYGDCFYYSARRGAQKAAIVITNHSVVIQDALMADRETGEGLLGEYDFLVLDEAHDFPQAAQSGLEFELSNGKLAALASIAHRLERTLLPVAEACGDAEGWTTLCSEFREQIQFGLKDLAAFGLSLLKPGILDAAPASLLTHPHVESNMSSKGIDVAKAVADALGSSCNRYLAGVEENLKRWRVEEPDKARKASDSVRNYKTFIGEFGLGAASLFQPQGVAVTYVGLTGSDTHFRQDVIDLQQPLKGLLWSKTPYACLSATVALDGSFDFFRRVTGVEPEFEEILESPFDHGLQAALYMPPANTIPDPTIARREGKEEQYYRAIARELSKIIETCQGRTLALFHSRKEMDGVYSFMRLPPELKLYTQTRVNPSGIGERFVSEIHSSLFALRSFWTGFDAPGETLSCVALVRVPFEVPMEPTQIARLAHLQQQGLDAFGEHTLPLAKMLMRQGAGRLIRRSEDRGVIALLDTRLQTKRYGEDILANMPPGMKLFHDIGDAAAFVGLSTGVLL